MISLIRTTILSVMIILGLCINVANKPIFSHIYQVISPGTILIQDATENVFATGIASVRTFTLKLFDNSVPKIKDSVKSNLSSPTRNHSHFHSNQPAEIIHVKEKKQLDELIKTHR